MAQNVFSTPYDTKNEPVLKEKLKKNKFNFTNTNHAFWRAQRDDLTITFYKSGKLLVQGWGAKEFAEKFLQASQEVNGLEKIEGLQSWIGTDEAGKGDFFGPLVVAAVFVQKKDLKDLMLLEIQDSKKMTDTKISIIAPQIKKRYKHKMVIVEPEKYNKLYDKYKNLNKLLAWAHAYAIDQLLREVDCSTVISDKFGDESLIATALGKRMKQFTLVQQTRAESNPGVAAAAIIARNGFVEYLGQLSDEFQLSFPKGASNNVIEAGKKFAQKYGTGQLYKVAKLHFKTVHKL